MYCYVERTDMSLGEVLHFIYGADKLPSTDFEFMPSICFTDCDRMPDSSTCNVSITFSWSLGLLLTKNLKGNLTWQSIGHVDMEKRKTTQTSTVVSAVTCFIMFTMCSYDKFFGF